MLTDEEAQIGKRIQIAREHYGTSRVLAAEHMSLSRQQIDRIERGEVAVRFRPAILFCQFAGINPLWLAFGESENRFGFFWIMHDPTCQAGYRILRNVTKIAALEMAADERFLDVMQRDRVLYSEASASLTSNEGPGWSFSIPIISQIESRKQLLTIKGMQKNIEPMNLQKLAFWPILRERISKIVQRRGMKSALARDIGVTRQAINAALSRKGTHGPSAELTLRLSKWVEIAEAQQKQSAGVSKPRGRGQ